ncbi:hypothetical protein EST38_g100 [Candolleomyces aberdarensis]|uniref:F-box domain-containing protein n=1 Tax=Candolleomyces aberdarensis TaxID=2316362 RepID=A0A4Q2E1Z7_9AGAR|nr:hypothetical protein EST38_g100 [Candolleomyces aberdarensis]
MAIVCPPPAALTPHFPALDTMASAERMMLKLTVRETTTTEEKPTIHVAIPRLRSRNLEQPLLRDLPAEVMLNIFKHAVEVDSEVHTAFSSFIRPRPSSTPLSLLAISKRCNEYAADQTELWTTVSGTQHEPNVPHPELIKLWIQRAGDIRRLNFHISPREYKCPDGVPDEFTERNLRMFMQHAPRWHHIAFELNDAMAQVYLKHLLDESKPKPGAVDCVELLAGSISSHDTARNLFSSIALYSSTVTELHWAGPRNFSPPEDASLKMERLTIFSVDAHNMTELVQCLDALDAPELEELWVCISIQDPGRDGVRWSSAVSIFCEALHRLATLPEVLLIQDDDIERVETVTALQTLGSKIGLSRLSIVSSNLAKIVGDLEEHPYRIRDEHSPEYRFHEDRMDIVFG